MIRSFVAGLSLFAFLPLAYAADESPKGTAVLGTSSLWRTYFVRGSDLVREDGGTLVHVDEITPIRRTKIKGKHKSVLNKVERVISVPQLPSADWTKPEFNDGDWGRFRGPFGFPGRRYSMRLRAGAVLLCLRGKFEVTDPARVAGLKLSLDYRGGVVVYVNGVELTRAHLPKGKLTGETAADEYPMSAYVMPDGKRLTRLRHRKKFADQFKQRNRALTAIEVPASMLRKGVNVLAIEIHRAPAAQAMYLGNRLDKPPRYVWWPRLAATKIDLVAAKPDGLMANVARPNGLQVWNHVLPRRVSAADYGDPNETVRPIRLSVPRNGVGSGQVVISSAKPFKGLRVKTSGLAGPGRIAADAIQIRYGLLGGPLHEGAPTFDGLEMFPPSEVPIATHKTRGRTVTFGAVQPIWVTVRVPKDARPGDYTGKFVITAEGGNPVEVPIELRVLEYVVCDPKDFTLFMGIIQSPHSVAMQYKVPFWSERHWKLIEKSFELIAQVGGDTLYIPLVRRTHLGNEHSMLRWIDKGNGKYAHDFGLIEKYLDIAVKHMGKIPVVVLYCWEPPYSVGHFGNYEPKDREILISVLDPATGKLTKAKGPAWESAECAEFWKPVMSGLRERLRKRGLAGSMMLGLAGDYKPTKAAVGAFKAAAPEAKWASHQHSFTHNLHGQPVGYVASVWGLWPSKYAWRNPIPVTRFPRNDIGKSTSLAFYSIYAEGWLGARGRYKKPTPGGYRGGVGRIGGDFWPVIKGRRNRSASIAGRYPETGWGQLKLNYATAYVLCPGRDGAIASVRFELMRQNVQEAEARAIIEDAAVLAKIKARVGSDLSARCMTLLKERTRTYSRAYSNGGPMWYASCGRRRRCEELYALAAEVATKLGTHK